MDGEIGPVGHGEAARPGDCQPEGDARLLQQASDLRTRVIEHCKWIATWDRDYAVEALNRYHELMPWLELRRKR